MTTKGFKVFDPNWACRGFQFEVGQTYKQMRRMELCGSGFHFCNKLADCFNYYRFDPNNKVAEIEAIGEVKSGDDKSVTNEIKIVREITWNEVLEMVNTGKGNTGLNNTGDSNTGDNNTGNRNTGDRNTGDSNTGNRNTGNRNTGYSNTGYSNTGNRNTGDSNTGYSNTGDRNTGNSNTGDRNTGYSNIGDRNTGNRNTGMFNSCNYGNGLFNSQSPKISMFNKPTKLTYEEFEQKHSEAYNLLRYSSFYLTEWVYSSDMTDEEKKQHPQYETTYGYLKVNDYKETCQKMWDKFSDKQKKAIKKLPNFDKNIFKDITGIEV
jgi:hypothetical protein